MSHRALSVTVATLQPRELDSNDIAIAFLGEAVTYAFRAEPLGTITCAVARAPAGAAATFTAGAITPDVVGYHRHTAQNGSAPAKARHLIVLPVAAKTDTRIKEPNRQVLPGATIADPSPLGELVVREILRSYFAEALRTNQDLATLTDSLTTPAPLPTSVDWRRHAPDGQ